MSTICPQSVHVDISTVDKCGQVVDSVDMNTWTPLFSKIVDSSLWSAPDFVCKVFVTMMALKDADQVVRYNAYALGKKCWPGDPKAEKRALEALKYLSSPDKERIEPQPHEGRRIQKVEGGWLLLNGQEYEDLMRALNRRAYKAGKQAEYRNKPDDDGARPELADAADLQEGGEQWRIDRQAAKTKELERVAEEVRSRHNPKYANEKA
jgi:hypothetical protein